MKRLTSLATFTILAVSAWAAPAPAATPLSRPPAVPAGMQAGAACPAPAAAPAKPTWKHGADEYNDYTAMAAVAAPAQKAKLAADFVQKYPDSDYKNQALELEMSAQAAAQPAAAVQTAETLSKSPGADQGELTAAYTIIAYDSPNIIQPTDADLQAKLATLNQAITCGQQIIASQPQAQAQYGPIFAKAAGFSALTGKNYPEAVTALTKAIQISPKDKVLYYWRGVAELTQSTPDFNAGIFDVAKSTTMPPPVPAIQDYLTQAYTNFHGWRNGLQDVVAQAQSNPTMPAGFKIVSAQEIQAQKDAADAAKAAEIAANTLPPEDSFAGIEARLKKTDMAETEWKSVKGQGYELDGLVTKISATGATVDVAVGETDATKNTPADLHVVLTPPLPASKRPKVGEKVTVSGVADSYKTTPDFLITFTQGSVKGFSPVAKP